MAQTQPQPQTPTPIRFGILGCADIARKVSRAISLSPNAIIYAIGSRSFEKAAKFAASNNFPDSAKIYGSYDAVLDDPNVDAVYVPLPTSLHIKWAVAAAEKKKHILLEKPVALNVGEFDKVVEACELNGLQLMDSTMWMHNPRTAKMKEFLSDTEKFGHLRSIHATFTFAADQDFLENDIRVKPDLDALGALGDAGWYCVRFILWANDFNLPKSVTALPGTIFNKAGVIISCGAALHWEDGKVATFHCSFLANLTMTVTASGTKGSLHLNDFVIPFEEKQGSFTTATDSGFTELVTGWAPLPSQHTVMTDLPQEARMVTEFSRLVKGVKNGDGAVEKMWPTISRKTQLVLDAVKTSVEKGGEAVSLS
ncbi:hypothetical protein QVD17_17192 [Tagetes erecta]|uniref:Gfo/Idh/MocA-like oxidoreductase N-terminal domain-containing protein n=1 Tax=Tagetes erecta TaxID=13708 RepID=A0AAD8P181_TARER|nr:hypothetical protein QVD17_17192 [Tagetes erecta]